jgi:hypothetical protein
VCNLSDEIKQKDTAEHGSPGAAVSFCYGKIYSCEKNHEEMVKENFAAEMAFLGQRNTHALFFLCCGGDGQDGNAASV